MPINKIIPRFLVSDKDERLLENGAMTDAINVTISENGNGTEGVIKNMVGTVAANAKNGSALTTNDAIKAIGQASDSQRGFLYVFVADVSGDLEHAIYQYNTKSVINDGLGVNEFRIVYKGAWLNFDSNSFIKVDVVNAAFQQDDNIQTILYFTDNINPPRKINVDRAISGDFDGLSDNDLDYALSAIKAPQTKPVTFGFATDTSIPVNNFARATFQFATQYIYKDGEESAVSPYSKLAFSNVVAAESLEEDTGVLFFTDNRCDLFLNWINGSTSPEENPSDVEKIRILGRRGNEGSFFTIDEIDPRVDLERTIDSPGLNNKVTVYEASSGTYKFYNNGLYPSIPSATVNKLYDNVPQKAAGQCVSNNRLFYSNYTEGYANHSVDAVWGVSYGSERGGGQVIFDGSEGLVTETSVEENGANTNYQLNIELTDLGSPLQVFGDTVPSGSLYSLSFDFIPKFDLFTSSGNIDTITASVDTGGNSTYNIGLSLGDPLLDPLSAARIDGGSFSYSTQIGSAPGETVQEFRDRFLAHLDNELGDITFSHNIDLTSSPVVLNYEITSDGGNLDFAIGDTIEDHLNSFDGSIKVEYKFSSVSDGNTRIKIRPYVSKISSNGNISLTFDSNGTSAQATSTFSFEKTFNSYTQQRLYNYNNSTSDAVDLSQNIAYYFVTNAAQKTFKAGCHHDFGVVYYDKYGRSGNVNKIGGFYAEFPGERSTPDGGAVSARVTVTNAAPLWADSWQLVYGGMQDYDRVFTYTTGKAYPALAVSDAGVVGGVDANRKQIYVAMIGLDEYQSERGALRKYSFTEGDKLRVVKHKTTDGTTWTYPLANDSVSLIEFNVVGVEILGGSNNPIAVAPTNEHKGTFLVLEAPLVAGGVDGQGGTTDLKYPGFDWFTVSGTNYPDSTTVGDIYWGRDSVVEIVTPKKVEQQVYYEIGERRAVKTYKTTPTGGQTAETGLSAWTNHGPTVIVDSTDTYLRQVPCKGPVYSGSWTTNSPAAYEYTSIEMESQDLSDFFVSDDWDKGRAFVYYEPSATVRRFNGITYSDAYAEDVSVLSLSSFNASLANFYSVDSKYGKLNYIGAYNEDIVGVQENKFSLIPIGKNIIEYAQGNGNVTVSTDVVGQPRYSSGDYGCGDNPESVLIQDGNVFFADKSRSSVLWFSGSQLVPISEQNTSSLFQNFFELGGDRYVSGYDPEDNIYYISSAVDTVGYDLTRQVWQSRYSFVPDLYISQNNMMYSTKFKTILGVGRILWSHSGDSNNQYNNFYGSNYDSLVQVVFNDFPSLVKVFNAISYEGSSGSWDMGTGMVTDLGQTSGTIASWDYREGSYYKYMPRDTADKYLYVGKADSPSGINLPLKENLNLIKLSFSPAGSYVYYGSSKEQGNIINSITANSVTVTPNIGLIANDDEIHFKIPNDGDTMRGHWAKVTFNLTSSTKNELYCINLHTAESKLSHGLTQQ